jgi:hypothetical protein
VLIRAMFYDQITALLGVECPQLSSIEGNSGLFARFLPTLEKIQASQLAFDLHPNRSLPRGVA